MTAELIAQTYGVEVEVLQDRAGNPVIQPVSTLASEMMRSVMPDTFIRLPASTNSGTASSGNDCVADAIRWVATRPAHVNIDRLVIRPRAQAANHKVQRVAP